MDQGDHLLDLLEDDEVLLIELLDLVLLDLRYGDEVNRDCEPAVPEACWG